MKIRKHKKAKSRLAERQAQYDRLDVKDKASRKRPGSMSGRKK